MREREEKEEREKNHKKKVKEDETLIKLQVSKLILIKISKNHQKNKRRQDIN